MPPKPHRVLLNRVSGYADEAAAYMRRRKIARRPFARVYYPNGRAADHDIDSKEGIALFVAADALVEVAGRVRRRRA
jgi:predicted alpha/beta-hydrolase family hydrolase